MTEPSIPFLDLVSMHRELEDELVDVLRNSLRSAAFIGGPQVEAFEQEFAAFCGTAHCVGVGSGTDAVRFALMAAGVCQGDAVVTVAHTFIATVESISQAGAATEFVDIDARTYMMDVTALERFLKDCRTDTSTGRPIGPRSGKPIKAIVPVHLYGACADMDRILELAAQYRLTVIEDACQAHGAEYRSANGDWQRAGSFGTAAAFSFYPGKNLGACGEAGAVTTNDAQVAQTIRMLRDHGQSKKYHHALEGYNGRLDAVQAGFLRVKLRRLDQWNAARRAAAERYRDLLAHIPGIDLPMESERTRGNHHLYVIRSADRDALAQELNANGVATGLHYPVPVHLQPCYKEWAYQPGSLPVTERIAEEILSLPMFPELTGPQQERVAAVLSAFRLQTAT